MLPSVGNAPYLTAVAVHMKKFRSVLVIIPLLVVLLGTKPTHTAAQNERWLFGATGYQRALELQREMKIPLVVYFYTDWCPYCRTLDSDYLTAAPVREYLRGVVKVRIRGRGFEITIYDLKFRLEVANCDLKHGKRKIWA